MIWLVLNCRCGDSCSVTSTAFNRTPISSLISNHHRAGSMLSLLANTQLSNGCNTVLAITSIKCDRRAQQSLAWTRQWKSQPENCEGGTRCFCCLLQWRRLWKKTSMAHYQCVRAFICWLAWKPVFFPSQVLLIPVKQVSVVFPLLVGWKAGQRLALRRKYKVWISQL